MNSLLAVVLILLGVYLLTRVVSPLRERLDPTDTIKPPTDNGLYSQDEIDRIWAMIPETDKSLWTRPDPYLYYSAENRIRDSKLLASDDVAAFYRYVYRPSQAPITSQQVTDYANRAGEGRGKRLLSVLHAYFIDQAPPPPPAPEPPAPEPIDESDPAASTPAPIDVAGRATITINVT
jgi:hypothetical protein